MNIYITGAIYEHIYITGAIYEHIYNLRYI